ncbi:plasmid recombination protein [Vibrio vulnificus]|nr:plasmid recombination protein [Vibrio vulnificus]ELI3524785.1 plasmid recombination protein [Vibrio vulnificus]
MTTTILRFEKHKYFANIRQAGAHQHRHHLSTPNADKCRSHLNKTFIGSSNLVEDVKKRLNVLTKQPRKNSVLAMDGVLALSPELFVGGTQEERHQTLKNFAIASKRWLISTFGNNVVNAVLHRDETSPHIHFTVVPVQTTALGESKLNARDMFNKETLHDFQRNYFESMHQYFPSLIPPKYREKATHTTLKEFYSGINRLEGKMDSHLNAEFEKQKECLQEEMAKTIQQHIEQWLEKLFVDLNDSEKDFWIKSIRTEFEQNIDKIITMQRFYPKLHNNIKKKITIN